VWFVESLAAGRAAGSPWNTAWTQLTFGLLAIARDDDQEAARLYEECLPVFQRMGYAVGVSHAVTIYSVVLLRLGAFDRAAKLLDETLDSFRPDLSLFELYMLHDQRGQVAYAQSDLRRASHHFVQALRFAREYGQQILLGSRGDALAGGAGVAAHAAARRVGESLQES